METNKATDDITVDVSGEMDPQITKNEKFPRFLQNLTTLPDPKEFIQQQRQNIRPWLLFIYTSNFKAPPSIPRLGVRIKKNIEYFQSNYLFVFIGLVIYCLVTSPLILVAVAGSFYVCYRLNQRHGENKTFKIFGKELSLAKQYGVVAVCSMPVYYMVGAPAAMFWVIGASFVIITLHASFYNIDAVIRQTEDGFPLLEEV